MGGQRLLLFFGLVVVGEYFQQFDFEQQVGVGFDVCVDLLFVVGQVGRDEQLLFVIDFYVYQVLVLIFDYLFGVDYVLEWLVVFVGGVEQCVVFQGVFVLGGDQCIFYYFFVVVQEEVFDLQLVVYGVVFVWFVESCDFVSKCVVCC